MKVTEYMRGSKWMEGWSRDSTDVGTDLPPQMHHIARREGSYVDGKMHGRWKYYLHGEADPYAEEVYEKGWLCSVESIHWIDYYCRETSSVIRCFKSTNMELLIIV